MKNLTSTLGALAALPLLLILIAGSGCESESQTLPQLELGRAVRIECANGSEYRENEGSTFYKSLGNWMERNKNGWKRAPASFVPCTKIYGKNFEMIVFQNMVVVSTSFSQYSKNLDGEVLFDMPCKRKC